MGLLKSIHFYIDVSEYDFKTKEIWRSCNNIFVIINGLINETNNSQYLLQYKPLLINFLNELVKILKDHEIFTWNDCNQFFNILYSYRYILLKFECELNLLGSYELFGQFPVLKVREDKEILSKYIALANQTQFVTFIGRLGTYRYLDMHVVIGESLDLAKRCLSEPSDFWPAFSVDPLS
jgi:UDP-galactopyranose mutase